MPLGGKGDTKIALTDCGTHLQLLEVVNTTILPHEDNNIMRMFQIQR